jgi:hypothetical protein
MKVVPKAPSGAAPPWGCLKDVAASRGIKYSSARYALANGLPYVKLGRALYVKFADFDQWLASREERAS